MYQISKVWAIVIYDLAHDVEILFDFVNMSCADPDA